MILKNQKYFKKNLKINKNLPLAFWLSTAKTLGEPAGCRTALVVNQFCDKKEEKNPSASQSGNIWNHHPFHPFHPWVDGNS